MPRNALAEEMRHTYQGDANAIGPLATGVKNYLSKFGPGYWEGVKGDIDSGMRNQLARSIMAVVQHSPEMQNNLGITPTRGESRNAIMDYMAAMPMNTESLSGAFGAIVSPMKAKTLNTLMKLPDDDIFRQAIANTPGAHITNDGLLMNIQRGQQPNQSMRPSVRGGVFYLPEGAAQMKHYSTGKQGYGGPEKIKGETLVTNPLFVKGGTGGKAPESAYDSLQGKGSYQSMRNDALKVLGYNLPKNEMASRADEFLDKYAPEMSGMGEYIVKSSTKGNQLPYALQEAAVSSAVRKAGHDSVLGYSKGKNGYFVSELFDVRESSYPDSFGGSKIFDSFMD